MLLISIGALGVFQKLLDDYWKSLSSTIVFLNELSLLLVHQKYNNLCLVLSRGNVQTVDCYSTKATMNCLVTIKRRLKKAYACVSDWPRKKILSIFWLKLLPKDHHFLMCFASLVNFKFAPGFRCIAFSLK